MGVYMKGMVDVHNMGGPLMSRTGRFTQHAALSGDLGAAYLMRMDFVLLVCCIANQTRAKPGLLDVVLNDS